MAVFVFVGESCRDLVSVDSVGRFQFETCDALPMRALAEAKALHCSAFKSSADVARPLLESCTGSDATIVGLQTRARRRC